MTIKQYGGVFGRNPTFNDVTIEGELTFDGDIDINSDLKIDGNLEVTGTSSLTGNTSISRPDNGVVDFNATNTGTTGTSNSRIRAYVSGATGGDPSIGVGITGVQDYYWSIDNSDSDKLKLLANGSPILDFTPAGAATFSDNVIIGTSGKGIDFSATAGTGTSELLDDYEEGLDSPTITPTTSGTIALNPSFDTLSYTKVGRQVTLTGLILVQASGTSSPIGGIAISLPFASVNLTDRAGDSAVALQVSNVSSANCADFVGSIIEGQSVLTIVLGDATTAQSDSAEQLVTNSAISLSVTYFTS